MGLVLIRTYGRLDKDSVGSLFSVIAHSFTNGSVLMVLGSLVIGWIADQKQAEGIKPFTTDIFKGFLSIFLLEMGMVTARRISAFKKYGFYAAGVAIWVPLLNGGITAAASKVFVNDSSDRFVLAVLAASASYIAVPASFKLESPRSDPGLFIPMAVGLTFPINITIGMPFYFSIIQAF